MQSEPHIGRLAKVNVLVSDNDEKIIKIMSDILKKLGFGGIFPAQDGFEAVSVLQNKKIHLIITDWELTPLGIHDNNSAEAEAPAIQWDVAPPENGAAFVKFVRTSRMSPSPFMPIVMLTGKALQHNIEYARDSGVDDILVKPISAVDLCRRVVKLVNHPRFFISAPTYKGPCRRRRNVPVENDRRKMAAKEIKRSVL